MWQLKQRIWQIFYFSDCTDLATVESEGNLLGNSLV